MPTTTAARRATARWTANAQAQTRYFAVNHSNDWTREEQEELLHLDSCGNSHKTIAFVLGRTYQAVAAQLHVLTADKPQPRLGAVCPKCFTTASLAGECLC